MGFFSWKTCDTKESIWNIYTGLSKPVYLLQPNGQEPILEPEYEGYGRFGGVDAYIWLAEKNMHILPESTREIWSESDLRQAGIELDLGQFYTDKESGDRWMIFHFSPLTKWLVKEHGFRSFPGRYDEPIPECGGLSANMLIDQGRFEQHSIKDLLTADTEYYPLKFSYDQGCVYEDWPGSEQCPNQGYFS